MDQELIKLKDSLKRINRKIEWERWKVNGMYDFQRKHVKDKSVKEHNEMLWREELHRLMKIKYQILIKIENEEENLDYYDRKFDLINNVESMMMFVDENDNTWTVVDVYYKKCHPAMVLMACEGLLKRVHTDDLLDYRYEGNRC